MNGGTLREDPAVPAVGGGATIVELANQVTERRRESKSLRFASDWADPSCLVVSVHRKRLGAESKENGVRLDSEALSITRLEGSRWRGGRPMEQEWRFWGRGVG